MSFFIDPNLKEIGASEMKDWIIFGLIIALLLFFGVSTSNKLERALDRQHNEIATLQSDNDLFLGRLTTLEANPAPKVTKPHAIKKKGH